MGHALLHRTAEYAFRAMTCIAREQETGPIRAVDLARCSGVPRPYLSKILRQLVVAGLLDSRRGHHGGFTLARPLEEIHLIDVLAAVDEDPTTGRCAFGWGKCSEHTPCPMHDLWTELNGPYQQWAKGHTLADLDLSRLPDSE